MEKKGIAAGFGEEVMTAEWNYEDEWFEETNVSRKIRDFLVQQDYEITKFCEDKKERGYDIEAEKDGQKIIMEVKGYPSDKYVSGPYKGEKKPTNPNLQAKHWFGEALLALLIAKSRNPVCKTVIGLPDFRIYRDLLERVKFVMMKLNMGYILVDERGHVEVEGI